MIKYLFYSSLLIASCAIENENKKTQHESIEYKLISPNENGEQYLTIIDSVVYYHGKVKTLTLDSTESSSIYFLSKTINLGPNQNGNANMMFYDFQYSEELLNISDFESSTFNDRGELLSVNLYNSMWGNLKGDTIILRATKHIYDSRSDEIKFIKD